MKIPRLSQLLFLCSFSLLIIPKHTHAAALFDHSGYCAKVDPSSVNTFERLRKPPAPAPPFKLSKVLIFSRHGARTPLQESSRYSCINRDVTPFNWNCTSYTGGFQIADFLGEELAHLQLSETRETTERADEPPEYTEEDTLSPSHSQQRYKFISFPRAYRFDFSSAFNIFGGSCYAGQLTNAGVTQLYLLGKYVADAYINVPAPLFNGEEFADQADKLIRFHSTDTRRTLASGEFFMEGFLRTARNNGKFFRDRLQEPLSVVVNDSKYDYLSTSRELCANFKELELDAIESVEYKAVLKKYHGVYKKFCKSADCLNRFSSYIHTHVFDCIHTTMCEGNSDHLLPVLNESYKISKAQNDTVKNLLLDAHIEEFGIIRLHNDAALAKCLSNNLVLRLKANLQSSDDTKIFYYSTHDDALMNLMYSLGYDEMFWPEYATMLLFEVYQDLAQLNYLRIVYNGEIVTHKFKGCEAYTNGYCVLDGFIHNITFASEETSGRMSEWEVATLPDSNHASFFSYIILCLTIFNVIIIAIYVYIMLRSRYRKYGRLLLSSSYNDV